uniref:Uncharacterized protein n=1 Tax=Lotharella oceanica TaxID=641309 RepID=A0A7S2XAY1_9EUKA|mmetsp:Transcript_22614/g.42480  ORF Transcript_22614/g.42480 Transcript_22614/m.42480 type:complete len:102 (+) Transcript_22614:742-1047(+)
MHWNEMQQQCSIDFGDGTARLEEPAGEKTADDESDRKFGNTVLEVLEKKILCGDATRSADDRHQPEHEQRPGSGSSLSIDDDSLHECFTIDDDLDLDDILI